MPSAAWDFAVRREDLRKSRFSPSPDAGHPLGQGEARLRIDGFALSANNLTYAVTGDRFGYWSLFPSADGWGRIPAWGFATVEHSDCPDVPTGDRYFGLLPMSTHLVVVPAATRTGFRDTRADRAATHPLYSRYVKVGTTPEKRLELEAAVRPVFILSFVLSQYLRDQSWFGAERIVVTSASSKVAIGLAHLLSGAAGPAVVGLTSARNRAFTENLGIYDRVLTYGETSRLPGHPTSVVIDVSGDRRVVQALRDRVGAHLASVVPVGRTHWDQTGPDSDTQMFFAPDHIKRSIAQWGASVFEERFDSALDRFCDLVHPWLTPEHHYGPDGLTSAYTGLLRGHTDPRAITVVKPGTARPTI